MAILGEEVRTSQPFYSYPIELYTSCVHIFPQKQYKILALIWHLCPNAATNRITISRPHTILHQAV